MPGLVLKRLRKKAKEVIIFTMKAKKTVLFISSVLLVALLAICLSACATEESALKEKYEQAGFDAQSFPFASASVDKDSVDFAYHGLKNANSSNVEQIFVITFNSIDDARNYYDAHVADSDKPNMMRQGRAVVYGSRDAVDLY